MKPFYIGLSCLSNDAEHHANTGEAEDHCSLNALQEGEVSPHGRARVPASPLCGALPRNAPPGGLGPPGPPLKTGRTLHAEGRRVLALLDAERSGRAREPAAIAAENGGRPFFVDRHADFNISHSRHMAAAAWSEAVNPASGLPLRVGCDIQHVSPGKNREAVARNYYSPDENDYIGAAGNTAEGERIERFYRIWVLKESYLKAKGLSVLDMRTSPSFAVRDGLVKETPVPFVFFLYELDGGNAGRYLLAVCREIPAAAPLPEIRWFSPPLALKHLAVIGAFRHRKGVSDTAGA